MSPWSPLDGGCEGFAHNVASRIGQRGWDRLAAGVGGRLCGELEDSGSSRRSQNPTMALATLVSEAVFSRVAFLAEDSDDTSALLNCGPSGWCVGIRGVARESQLPILGRPT